MRPRNSNGSRDSGSALSASTTWMSRMASSAAAAVTSAAMSALPATSSPRRMRSRCACSTPPVAAFPVCSPGAQVGARGSDEGVEGVIPIRDGM